MTILWAVTVVVLCAVPCLALGVYDLDLDYAIMGDWLDVYGTLNMNPGAYVDWGIYASSSSTVNIYAGEIGVNPNSEPYAIQVYDGATVTVYGTDFTVTNGTIEPDGSWIPGTNTGGTLTGEYENGDPIDLLFYSDVPILLAPPGGQENNPPVAYAGPDLTVFTKDIASTVIAGTATDSDEGDSLQYRWVEGEVEFTLWAPVGASGEAPLNLGTIDPQYLGVGTHTLTLKVNDGTETVSDDMVLTIEIAPITIDIKPGSYPNSINLGSNGVVPVAILSETGFDATNVDPDTVALAGAGVAVRGKGNKSLAHEEDVNNDGLLDLVCQVETENLGPGTFQDGGAFLQILDTSDPENPIVVYEGWDEITIVPPE